MDSRKRVGEEHSNLAAAKGFEVRTSILTQPPSSETLAFLFQEYSARPVLPPIYHREWECIAVKPLARRWHNRLEQLALEERSNAAGKELRKRIGAIAFCGLVHPEATVWQSRLFQNWQQLLSLEDAGDAAELPLSFGEELAETAHLLAITANLFGEVVPDPLLETTLRWLELRAWQPYLACARNGHRFEWMSDASSATAVGHLGVIGSAFCFASDRELTLHLAEAAIPFLNSYIESIARNTSEPRGFEQFLLLNSYLEVRTCGLLSLIRDDPRIAQIRKLMGRPRAPRNPDEVNIGQFEHLRLLLAAPSRTRVR